MSGGHFEYKQCHIGEIRKEVERIIETNDNKMPDDWGDPLGCNFQPEVIKRLHEAVETLSRAEIMVERIDYLMSGDDSEKTFIERWNEEVKELKNESNS